ncbi:PH domain-containing protein (plasmid) [Virgibacillus necropolis]|uniref:PH domain-containing protein n=1 Tax=Virgibacillus necropolis TaxID=163877 RepID=UPI00384AD698
MKFKPKKSLFHFIMNYIVMASLITAILAILFVPTNDGSSIILKGFVAILLLVASIYIGWVWWGAYYSIVDDILFISFGPHKIKVPISDIVSIKYTKGILASAAFSFEKYEITYGKLTTNVAMVSPKNKDTFISYLQRQNPDIHIND